MIVSADVVVIGSGAFGASAAYHLRFAGRALDDAELRERCRRAYATHYRAGSETPAGS